MGIPKDYKLGIMKIDIRCDFCNELCLFPYISQSLCVGEDGFTFDEYGWRCSKCSKTTYTNTKKDVE